MQFRTDPLFVGEWVSELLVAYDRDPHEKVGLIREYVKTLCSWYLTEQQWGQLKELAKVRHDFFPRISQLYDLAVELKNDQEITDNNARLRLIHGGK